MSKISRHVCVKYKKAISIFHVESKGEKIGAATQDTTLEATQEKIPATKSGHWKVLK